MKAKEKNLFFILIFLLLFASIFSGFKLTKVYALDNGIYSKALEDLKKDENFSEENYSEDTQNNSLQIIQIAESEAKELFIYVYQPNITLDLTATSISLSTSINNNAKWNLYKLELLDYEKTIFKYLVKDFKVKEDAIRYYDISNIYRKFNANIDTDTGNDNTINEKVVSISKLWTACTVEEKTTYTCTETEVIEINNPYNGFLRYESGFWLFGNKECDSHFVAFSLDREIKKLYEADVNFDTQSISENYGFGILLSTHKGEIINNQKTIYSDERVSNPNTGIFGYEHSWCRIETVTDFIKNENITEETKNNLKNKQWVLRFVETPYTVSGDIKTKTKSFTQVTSVTVLRLKFEQNGTVYNLGVIADKRSGDLIPDNNQDQLWQQILKYLKYIGLALLCIIGLFVTMPLLIIILMGFIKLVPNVFKGLWWAICLPFNFIKTKTLEGNNEE